MDFYVHMCYKEKPRLHQQLEQLITSNEAKALINNIVY